MAIVLLSLTDVCNRQRSVSTIPGSIDIAEFEAHPDLYKDKEIVAYCTVGYLSAAKVCEYQRKGLKNIKNFGDGALLGYTLAKTSAGVKQPLVTKDGAATNQVHTFMPDLAPLAGEGMEAKSYQDPGAVLSAANAKIQETLGL
jgi:rhodanese-related sulfurtransferase